MNRSKLKTYAPQARRDFIRAMTDRAAFYGLGKDKIEPVTVQGDVALIGGKAFPAAIAAKRERLRERVERNGFDQTMEAMAYTWFNRLVAIRYMELHGYLDHGYRVLSHPEGKPTPEIVEHAEHVDLPGLDRDEVINLKLDGTKEAELYRKLLIAQCNALHTAMPFLFERIADETELLLPDSLLHSDSLVRKLVTEIDEADWQEVEIIGWLYQFYISEKKADVIGSVVKSEDIPAATQLFTPNWIVKYLVQNSLGRQWLATYPDSPLKAKMAFYIVPAEQTPEVQTQLKAITPDSLNPEELTFLDPACGSGHILVEAYDLLKDIYLERGYRLRDIPKLILTKNLFGLEIDDRAAQLAAFALLMMARADDRNILSSGVTLNVLAIQQTDHLDTEALLQAFSYTKLPAKPQATGGEFGFMDEVRAPLYANAPVLTPAADPLVADLRLLLEFFKGAKTYGSLLQVPPVVAAKVPVLRERIAALLHDGDLTAAGVGMLNDIVRQADLLSQQYACVAANPPYMGGKGQTAKLKAFLGQQFNEGKSDTFAAFILRCRALARHSGHIGIMCPFVWMFISSYESLRTNLLNTATLSTLVQLEYSGFDGATVPVCTFTFRNFHLEGYTAAFIKLSAFRGPENQAPRTLEAIRNPQCGWYHALPPDDLRMIPGSPIAFWLSKSLVASFSNSKRVGDVSETRVGMATGDNARFVRMWHEIKFDTIGFAHTRSSAKESGKRWFPYANGGETRRWFGNNEFVVDWKNDGSVLQSELHESGRVRAHNFNLDRIFSSGITWSLINAHYFGARLLPQGFLFSSGSPSLFAPPSHLRLLLGLLNSNVARELQVALNPTLNNNSGDADRLPFTLDGERAGGISENVQRLIDLSKIDYDSRETSPDFTKPLLSAQVVNGRLADAWHSTANTLTQLRQDVAHCEEVNNRLIADAMGIGSGVSASITDDAVKVGRCDHAGAVTQLLSYAIGCAMGRYSLDKPGLIYAYSGNDGFDPAAYATFPADKDGIIPVTEEHWFADDAAARFEEFVGKAWAAEHLDENLAFVAEGLGAKTSESPRQTIRRHLSDGFYKHHLQTYKRRPIYWLFTSGKQRAFQALVYLHRYNEGTLSRMRTEYVIPLQGKIAARIEKLEADKAKSTSTSHGKAIQKEQDKLRKQQQELIAFDEKLRHYADLRINLDLDDGVKVNYRKFADPAIGEIVAEVKAVCGKEDDE